MKFMWAVVAVLVIMALVVSIMSVVNNCSGDEEDAAACAYETVYEQEPACAEYVCGAYEFTL